MNMARSMLKAKNLSNEYWSEAVACSVYILNLSPTSSLENQVPQEAWSGMKSSVSHFKVFGCVAYAHVPEEMRRNLDDRSEKCIFVGYSEQSKAYRLYNPITKKLIVSRDVKFQEDKSWDNQTSEMIVDHIPSIQEDKQVEATGQQASPPRLPRLQVQGQGEQTEHSSSSSSSNDSDPTIENLRNQKTRSLREIYEQNDDVDQQAHFSMLSYQPVYFEEAVKEEKWVDAMNEEIEAIERNDTWDLVDLPTGKTNIGVKWVYKTKFNEKGKVEKKKERLVAKGFAQQPGIDYGETFSPVARLDTVRAVLAVAAQKKWPVYQMDVKSTFLNGILQEEVYVDQPPGFQIKGKEYKVYRLKKALYSLKQAPRAWYSHIDSYFLNNGFNRATMNPHFTPKEIRKVIF
jgi:hypothetical protein